MAAPRRYLSGASKRKQSQARLENEAKNRRTFEDLGWGISTEQQDNNSGQQTEENTVNTFEANRSCSSQTSLRQSHVQIHQSDSDESNQESPTQTQTQYEAVVPAQQSRSSATENPANVEDVDDRHVRHAEPASQQFNLPTSDPATWIQLTQAQRDLIVRNGPPENPGCFPRDSSGRRFPENTFFSTLPNGEKVHRDWLVWSLSVQGLFCFPCCVFQGFGERREPNTSLLVRSEGGIKDNWRKLYDKIEAHQRNPVHISRYCDWKSLEETLKKPVGIDSALQKQLDAETAKWREIFRCILDVVLFLSERNLPFRGSSSKIGDSHNGLFLGTLELLSRHNKVLELHLQDVKQHQDEQIRMQAHYLSWRSQNEFIEECAKLVLGTILKEVKKAFYYSIIVDGTPDVSHTEQITFILRYVHQNEENIWEIEERFLKLEDCEKKKGRDIAELICKVLEEQGIDLQNCRGQGYDNGSNMAGIYRGAQAVVLQKNPQAIFSPCSAHSLNLCGVHAAESSVIVKSFFGNIQKLYNLFSSSPARWKILQETAHVSLHKMSVTRWSARIEAVKPLTKRPREILKALSRLREELDLPADICNEVDCLAQWLQSFQYVLLATFWFKSLQAINDVSLLLQSSEITLDEELRLIKSLLNDLKRLRESWDLILQESKLVAHGLGFEENLKKKRRRIVRTFHDEDRASAHEHEDEEMDFKVNVFNVTLDTLVSQITNRYQITEKVNNMFSFLWNPTATANDEDAITVKSQELSKFYPKDLKADEVIEEVRQINKLKSGAHLFGEVSKVSSLLLLNRIHEKGLQNIFPQICVALRIFVSIPVSVAAGERSFSKLAIVKNCRRSTMGQDRLSGLIMLSAERDLARKVNYDSVISSFALRMARKIRIRVV